jgi:hypothetical protein
LILSFSSLRSLRLLQSFVLVAKGRSVCLESFVLVSCAYPVGSEVRLSRARARAISAFARSITLANLATSAFAFSTSVCA